MPGFRICLLVILLVVSGVPHVVAGPIAFDITSTVLVPGSPDHSTIYASNNPRLGVTFVTTGQADPTGILATVGTTLVMLENLQVVSKMPPGMSNAKGLIARAPFTLDIGLTDEASGRSGTLAFQGSLSTTIEMMVNGSILPHPGMPPVTGWGFVPNISYQSPTESIVLGSNRYRVTMDPPLSFPGGLGNFGMLTTVSTTVNSPEPGTLILAGIAGGILLILRWHQLVNLFSRICFH